MFEYLTAQQAAAEIVGLINSSPRSPRREEIEAILARVAVVGEPARQRSALAEEYIKLHNWWAEPLVDEHDEAELDRRFAAVSAARLRIVQDGTDIEALATVVISILQCTEIDFDNPAALDEADEGGLGQWAGHALAIAVLRH
jgi:hypothetical protein